MMYGLPNQLSLDYLKGAIVSQIRVGEHQVSICFHDGSYIDIESEIVVEGATLKAGGTSGALLLGYLGSVVTLAQAVDSRHLRLSFEDQPDFLIVESDEPYESYHVSDPNGQKTTV
ncbi:DUF6188 family protein [Planctomycetota bacterium]|nr:DUF6188 family protein [Planctomycetota bacterium]